MKTMHAAQLAILLMTVAAGPAGANNYYLCSYEVYQDNRPVVRRIEYYTPNLQTARSEFESFLRQLEAQGQTPRNLGCR